MKLLIASLVTAIFLVGCGATNDIKPTTDKRAAKTQDLITDEQDGIVKDAIKTTGSEVKNEVRGLIRGIFR